MTNLDEKMLNKNVHKDIPIHVYFDGSCTPDFRIGWGFIIKRNNEIIHEGTGWQDWSEENSSNTAEYMGLHDAVITIIKKKLNNEPILFLGDSKMVIKQMAGEYGINAGRYVNTARVVQSLINEYVSEAYFKWIPRELNAEADALSHFGCHSDNGIVFDPLPAQR